MATHTTNYRNTFIAVSPDCRAVAGTVPPKAGSVAGVHYALMAGQSFAMTSDEVLFETHAARSGIADGERDAAREEFFARGQPCLRASPLVKSYGWGIAHDAEGRVALFGVESDAYGSMRARTDLVQIAGMRNARQAGMRNARQGRET